MQISKLKKVDIHKKQRSQLEAAKVAQTALNHFPELVELAKAVRRVDWMVSTNDQFFMVGVKKAKRVREALAAIEGVE